MNVIDLFSGIGGFSLGLERAGMKTVSFCEINSYCREVLAEHWPSVPCHADVTSRDFQEGEADVICGGFPCQDISLAGAGAGLSGERSGLYRELVRAIRMVRPRYAIMENVAALLSRGMGTVLGDLAEIGHDAEWHCIPASAVGAPHRRDRVWIITHPQGRGDGRDGIGKARAGQSSAASPHMANAIGARLEGRPILAGYIADELAALKRGGEVLAYPVSERLQTGRNSRGDGISASRSSDNRAKIASRCNGASRDWWLVEPDVGRVAHGVPARVDRLRALGNAVVPQIPEAIGRAIMNLTEG